MVDLILIGAGGHASDVLGVVESVDRELCVPSRAVGLLLDDKADLEIERIGKGRNVRILGSPDSLGEYQAEYVIAVGYPNARRSIHERVRGFHNHPATLVHPGAELGTDVTVGDGSVILSGVRISPLARIGSHVYISHLAGIGHHTVVGDYVSVMPGAMISGDVVLGTGALVGTNATVLEKLSIGIGATVGAGALVTKDVPAGATVTGVPARPVPPKRA